MEKAMNLQVLEQLINKYRSDEFMTQTLEDILLSFEKYHDSIYRLEISRALYSTEIMDRDAYQSTIQQLDKNRTILHNDLIVQVNLLNRLAEKAGFPPVYDGIVSKERPYRREVADAVLAYVRQVITNRS